MAKIAAQLREQRLARRAVGRQRPVRVAVRAGVDVIERRDVGRQRIEIRTEAGLHVAERLVARADVQDVVRDEAFAAEELADLVLEVLHLVQRGGPGETPLPGPRPPAQRERVPKAFAARTEVIDAAVLDALE